MWPCSVKSENPKIEALGDCRANQGYRGEGEFPIQPDINTAVVGMTFSNLRMSGRPVMHLRIPRSELAEQSVTP